MRWFRRKSADQPDGADAGRQRIIVEDVRQRFGIHQPGPFGAQADALAGLLTADPDGLGAAALIVHEFAESAHREIQRLAAELSHRLRYQFAVDRTNYRPLWREAQPDLQWPLFGLPCALFPYIHVAAAVRVLGAQPKSVPHQDLLLTHLYEILDLTIDGWEFARIRVDTDGAGLMSALIETMRNIRMAMSKEPPLPTPIREWMRRNTTVDVYAPDAPHVVTRINPGREMREVLLA